MRCRNSSPVPTNLSYDQPSLRECTSIYAQDRRSVMKMFEYTRQDLGGQYPGHGASVAPLPGHNRQKGESGDFALPSEDTVRRGGFDNSRELSTELSRPDGFDLSAKAVFQYDSESSLSCKYAQISNEERQYMNMRVLSLGENTFLCLALSADGDRNHLNISSGDL